MRKWWGIFIGIAAFIVVLLIRDFILEWCMGLEPLTTMDYYFAYMCDVDHPMNMIGAVFVDKKDKPLTFEEVREKLHQNTKDISRCRHRL